MRRETVRLLVPGAVVIESRTEDGAVAVVSGDTGVRSVEVAANGAITCSCPATLGACSHVRAVALVLGLNGGTTA